MNPLITELSAIFPEERLKHKLIERHAYSVDAGFYQLIPQAIVFPDGIAEVQQLMQLAKKTNTPVTFRTGGTSLSGQSVTEGILADLSRYWNKLTVNKDAASVTVQPGITGATVNHTLRKSGKKIGPDPASINAAMMGGILSNNASGMCCGVKDNSYHTLKHIHFVLPDGKIYNTAVEKDYVRFLDESKTIADGIIQLKNEVLANDSLSSEIRRKYKMKNTVGYGINAFLDYEHPLDILAHLLIGAEGTLAFIAEATLHTLPDKPFKKTGLLFFDTPKSACDTIPLLKQTNVEALEFMDRPALRSIEHLKDTPAFIKDLADDVSCILCEYQSNSKEDLAILFNHASEKINTLPVIHKTEFTEDAVTQALYWKLRKGMYPSVAAVRAKGSSVMLEDVAVPVDDLGNAIVDLQQLFHKHGYDDAIVFGHAKEGNLHFLVSQPVATTAEIKQFEIFNDELAELIVKKYRGSLKAEHGTGRQIAPYVKDEWGQDGYAIMQKLKQLVDPDKILNPCVIINNDDKCHLKHLKSLPVVEDEVDKCVECGYCEHKCPSREYTLSPRQRIVLRRTLARMKAAGEKEQYNEILKDYTHYGLDTCAVDGMCATECPVEINTGDLVKRLRRENHSARANKIALLIARNFKTTEHLVKFGLHAGNLFNKLLGSTFMYKLTMLVRKLIPAFPIWTKQLTGPVKTPATKHQLPDVLYFPACMTRMMGADKEKEKTIVDSMLSLAEKANINIMIPENIAGQCCGQAFSSKGFSDAYNYTANKMIAYLWNATGNGKIPVVLDITSCTYSLKTSRPYLTAENQQHFDQMTIMDSIEFSSEVLLPKLNITQKKDSIVVHPVCSVHKLNLQQSLSKITNTAAEHIVVPFAASCCGMAGDRGFYYPGLLQSATKKEAAEVKQQSTEECYSSGKPCEMSMSETTGKNYRSVFYLLDEVSEKK